MGLFDKTSLPALERAMSLVTWKQRAHASNVANASTPGYQRVEARFSDVLAATEGPQLGVEKTAPGHLSATAPGVNPVQLHVVPATEGSPNVELDQELVALAQDELAFDLESRVAALRLAGIRASITGKK